MFQQLIKLCLKIIKLEAYEANSSMAKFTNNISGNNNHITQNSVEISINLVSINPEISAQLASLRRAVNDLGLDYLARNEALDIIEKVELQIKNIPVKKSIIKSLLNSLPSVEAITSIVASILSMIN